MKTKISAEKIAAVIAEVPGTLQALDEDRNQWRTRAVSAETELTKRATADRISKIAAAMEEKGLDSSHSFEERVSMLEKQADSGRLDVIEEAIALSAADRPLGELADVAGHSLSDFENFILGDLA